jgi:hypothetical protein
VSVDGVKSKILEVCFNHDIEEVLGSAIRIGLFPERRRSPQGDSRSLTPTSQRP